MAEISRRGFLKAIGIAAALPLGGAKLIGLSRDNLVSMLPKPKLKSVGATWDGGAGGYLSSPQLSSRIRNAILEDTKFRQFSNFKTFSSPKTIGWKRYS